MGGVYIMDMLGKKMGCKRFYDSTENEMQLKAHGLFFCLS